jgi:hypothetical protein
MTTTKRKPIEEGRLRRALDLKCDRIGSGGWMAGGRLVDEQTGCQCQDRTLRGETCKHELATRLAVLDAPLLDALSALVDDE